MTSPTVADLQSRLRQHQRQLLILLTVGYAGYYLCRSNLSIATPLILREYNHLGVTKEQIGQIAFLGTLVYTGGKLVNGVLAHVLGGRFLFLLGMVGCVCATILSATVAFGPAGGLATFAVLWGVNRFFGSMGWAGLMELTARWYAPTAMATVLGIISISYLAGDAVARFTLGTVMDELALGWRGMYLVAAAALASLAVLGWLRLRSSPREIGCAEPPQSPLALVSAEDHWSIQARLGILMASRAFWLICGLSLGLTVIRETFNFWSPTYFTEIVGLLPGEAARASALVPLIGAISAVMMGLASDRFAHRPGLTLLPPMLALIGLIWLLSYLDLRGRPTEAVAIICTIQFVLIAPYTLCGGYFAVNLGGRQAAAMAAGMIDAAGYLGAALADWTIGILAERLGWAYAFRCLAGVVVVTAVVGLWYARHATALRLRRVAAASAAQPPPADPSPASVGSPGQPTATSTTRPQE